MTESTALSPDRVAEIIAAYGGDTSRWPDAERVDALRTVAAHPDLAAALAAAGVLDRDLVDWARAPVRGGGSAAAATAVAAAAVTTATRQPRSIMGWAAGGSIAASLAAAIVLLTPSPLVQSTAVSGVHSVLMSDEAAFAQVFTPTPDEENIL